MRFYFDTAGRFTFAQVANSWSAILTRKTEFLAKKPLRLRFLQVSKHLETAFPQVAENRELDLMAKMLKMTLKNVIEATFLPKIQFCGSESTVEKLRPGETMQMLIDRTVFFFQVK